MTSLPECCDVAIVGAGPAGTTLAWRLARRGLAVVIIEMQDFPRHRIGESLTGTAGALLREMGLEENMQAFGFPVKRGVKVFGPQPSSTFHVPIQDILEDGSRIENPTWQVRRPEFDDLLLKTAIDAGAQHVSARARRVSYRDDRVSGVELKLACGTTHKLSCHFVADASGFGTFLSSAGALGKRHNGDFEKQIAFFAQLDGVQRDAGPTNGNTLLYYSKQHHWAWHIPLSDTLTSVGIVVPRETFLKHSLTPEAFYDLQLRDLHPELADRTSGAKRVTEVWRRANYSYEIEDFAGPGFVAIGDSHRFLDPIFSFGVWMGLKEAELADDMIARSLADPSQEAQAFEDFMRASNRAQAVVDTILKTFWTAPLVFLKLAHFTHREEFADLLAGRIFDADVDQLETIQLMRGVLAAHQTADQGLQYASG